MALGHHSPAGGDTPVGMEKPITPAADKAATCCMPAISILEQTIPSHLPIDPSKPTPSRFLLWHPVEFNRLPRSAREEVGRSKVDIRGSRMTNVSPHLHLGIGWHQIHQGLTSRTN